MNLNPLKRRGILLKIIFTVVVPVHTKIGKTCRATCQNLVIKGTFHKLRYQKKLDKMLSENQWVLFPIIP